MSVLLSEPDAALRALGPAEADEMDEQMVDLELRDELGDVEPVPERQVCEKSSEPTK